MEEGVGAEKLEIIDTLKCFKDGAMFVIPWQLWVCKQDVSGATHYLSGTVTISGAFRRFGYWEEEDEQPPWCPGSPEVVLSEEHFPTHLLHFTENTAAKTAK